VEEKRKRKKKEERRKSRSLLEIEKAREKEGKGGKKGKRKERASEKRGKKERERIGKGTREKKEDERERRKRRGKAERIGKSSQKQPEETNQHRLPISDTIWTGSSCPGRMPRQLERRTGAVRACTAQTETVRSRSWSHSRNETPRLTDHPPSPQPRTWIFSDDLMRADDRTNNIRRPEPDVSWMLEVSSHSTLGADRNATPSHDRCIRSI